MARLVETYPQLAAEIVEALTQTGELELAKQVPQLTIVLMCDCGDDFCQSIYTAPKPASTWGPKLRNVTPPCPWPGMLVLDVVDEHITYIETIDRHPLD